MKIITLTTDFGLRDWFVGTMKGVVATINPEARVVDITHGIAPGDVRAGAFALAASYRYFPKGTVHVAVVDPEVGGDREAIAVQTEDYWFVGPDNGALSLALQEEQVQAIHRISKAKYRLPLVGNTFHGRDVFAPAAAHLSCGVSVAELGEKRAMYLPVEWPEPKVVPGGWDGRVVYVDGFGNGITNLRLEQLNAVAPGGACRLEVASWRLQGVQRCYADVPVGKPVVVVGSTGFLEIAVNGGSAARKMKLRVGSRVKVRGGRGRIHGSTS